jgi:hypothetical protein
MIVMGEVAVVLLVVKELNAGKRGPWFMVLATVITYKNWLRRRSTGLAGPVNQNQ